MNLSFIKLDINIMDDSKIKFIVKLPDGDKLFRLWIGFLCLAMKSGRPGIVEIGDSIPFNAEMLASHFDLELNTVKLALQTFERLKMIEVWDNGTLFITNFMKHQQLDKIERAREVSRTSSKKYREKIKILGDGHVNKNDVTEKEEEKELEQEKCVSITLPETLQNEDFIQTIWIKSFGRNPKEPEREETEKQLNQFGYEKTLRLYKDAVKSGVKVIRTLVEHTDSEGNFIPFTNNKQNATETKPAAHRYL